MTQEVRAAMADVPPGWVVDATLGGGGHSAALLAFRSDLRVLGVDRDPAALAAASGRLSEFGSRFVPAHGRFSEVDALCRDQGIAELSGLVADLGVSSHQLDVAGRGFSFRAGGPLDMRMDPTTGSPLSERLARASQAELADVLFHYGEIRGARRMASVVLQAFGQGIHDTAALAELVARETRGPRGRIHPATQVFQALRIWVNEEEHELTRLLEVGPELLAPGGVMVAIAFHSGEDRMVKRRYRYLGARRGAAYERPGGQPLRPAEAEVAANPRARSARARVLRRIPQARGEC